MLNSDTTELFRMGEIARLIGNLVRVATLTEIDFQNKKVKAVDGELTFGWLDWPCEVGRNFRRWRPLRTGTQVVIVSPGGDTTQGKIVEMLYTESLPAPSDDEAVDLIQFNDGALVEYNSATGDMLFKAKNSLTWEAPRHVIKGPVTQTGGDMTSDGVSAQNHRHEKTAPHLSAKSGKPDK